MDPNQLRDAVVAGLHAYTGRPVVLSDQVVAEAEAPYLYYQFLQSYIPLGGANYEVTDVEEDDDVTVSRTEQAEATLSITACAYNEWGDSVRHGDDTAMSLAWLARKWFFLSGFATLQNAGVAVVSIENIAPRTALDYVDVARRHGFDVRLRYSLTDTDTRPAIKTARAVESEVTQ